MPSRGKSARQAGHQWERDTANLISEYTGLEIITTRSIGANYGADLCQVIATDALGRPVETTSVILGWSIECKNEGKWRPEAWLTQAKNQRVPGSRPLVLAKKRNHSILQAWAIMDDPTYGMTMTTLGRWLKALRQARSNPPTASGQNTTDAKVIPLAAASATRSAPRSDSEPYDGVCWICAQSTTVQYGVCFDCDGEGEAH